METLDKIVPRALLVVSAGLLCWGLLGLLEYALPALGLGLQNSGFPDGLQFLHFFAIALTGTIFVLGYLRRWPPTPHATITMYAVLATLCFVETIDFGAFGGGVTGVAIMLVEFALYIGLSTYLIRSPSSASVLQRRCPQTGHRFSAGLSRAPGDWGLRVTKGTFTALEEPLLDPRGSDVALLVGLKAGGMDAGSSCPHPITGSALRNSSAADAPAIRPCSAPGSLRRRRPIPAIVVK
jgi:hypothetical protein